MNEGEDEMRRPERRASGRVVAEHAARIQFVTRIGGASGLSHEELWPTLICRTRDVSEDGVRLDVPVLREGDTSFYGVEGPVRVTLGLPTGAVEARGVTVRYAKTEGGGRGFFLGVRITDIDGASAESLRAYLRASKNS